MCCLVRTGALGADMRRLAVDLWCAYREGKGEERAVAMVGKYLNRDGRHGTLITGVL